MGSGPLKKDETPTQMQTSSPTTDHELRGVIPDKASEDRKETKIMEEGTKDSSSSKPTQGPEHPTKKSTEAKEKITKKLFEAPKRALHMVESILKDADDKSSVASNIYSGVFLNNKRKKLWIDEKTGHNCFILFARDLEITWGEDPRYWHWSPTCDAEIEVVSLLNVCWLEVHGKLDTSYLTPNVAYEAAFLVMLKDPTYGWDAPVNLKLKLPDGSIKEHSESLKDKPQGKWIELKAGEFTINVDQKGELEVSLIECQGGQWKRGLIIKGIKIQPKLWTQTLTIECLSSDM